MQGHPIVVVHDLVVQSIPSAFEVPSSYGQVLATLFVVSFHYQLGVLLALVVWAVPKDKHYIRSPTFLIFDTMCDKSIRSLSSRKESINFVSLIFSCDFESVFVFETTPVDICSVTP